MVKLSNGPHRKERTKRNELVSASLLMGFSFVNRFFCRVKHSLCENERHYKKDCALSYSDHYLKDI